MEPLMSTIQICSYVLTEKKLYILPETKNFRNVSKQYNTCMVKLQKCSYAAKLLASKNLQI